MTAIRVNVPYFFGEYDDLTGRRYGMLTCLDFNYRSLYRWGNVMWLTRCDCGKEIFFAAPTLRERFSCGCTRKDGTKVKWRYSIKSAYSDAHEFKRLAGKFRGMVSRCYNPNDGLYKWYGARGITVCDEWLKDFDTFFLWSMANGYKFTMTIDRIDKTKGYSQNNCRYVTRSKGSKNNRRLQEKRERGRMDHNIHGNQ